jgi:hypothetical protein
MNRTSQTMNQYKNPQWWTDAHDTVWNRVKLAIKRDWDQTKHDLGGNDPDTKQNVSNTSRQAIGKEVIPPQRDPTDADVESAHRFGFGARSQYRDEYPEWDDELEAQLKRDWQATGAAENWDQNRDAVRYGWDYDEDLP